MIETITTAKLIISCAVGLTLFAISRAVPSLATRSSVNWFFVIWCLIVLFEHFALGPFSFVANETDIRNLGFLKGVARLGGDSYFNPQLAGGVDMAFFVQGLQSISLERATNAVLPPLGVVTSHCLARLLRRLPAGAEPR